MDPATLPKTLRRFASIIEEISDERESGDGIWVYLVAGYWNPMLETHCVHEDTLKACAAALKDCEKCESTTNKS